jgi:hypothetical protein
MPLFWDFSLLLISFYQQMQTRCLKKLNVDPHRTRPCQKSWALNVTTQKSLYFLDVILVFLQKLVESNIHKG